MKKMEKKIIEKKEDGTRHERQFLNSVMHVDQNRGKANWVDQYRRQTYMQGRRK